MSSSPDRILSPITQITTSKTRLRFHKNNNQLCGPGSSVGIATGYGLDGPAIESRWEQDFPHLSRPALGPTQTPVQWLPGLSREKERPGRDADRSPPSSAVGHETVELYLYSPYGPYGLYRASVPVQGVHFTTNQLVYPQR